MGGAALLLGTAAASTAVHCITLLISFPPASARACGVPCVAAMLLHSFMVSDCFAAIISICMRSWVAYSVQLLSSRSMLSTFGSYSRVVFAISSIGTDVAPIVAPYLGHMRRLRCPSGVAAMRRCFAPVSGAAGSSFVFAAPEPKPPPPPS